MDKVREVAREQEREREKERQALDGAQDKTMMAMRERQEAVQQAQVSREECMQQQSALLQLQRERVQPLESLVEQAQVLKSLIFGFIVTLYSKYTLEFIDHEMTEHDM